MLLLLVLVLQFVVWEAVCSWQLCMGMEGENRGLKLGDSAIVRLLWIDSGEGSGWMVTTVRLLTGR